MGTARWIVLLPGSVQLLFVESSLSDCSCGYDSLLGAFPHSLALPPQGREGENIHSGSPSSLCGEGFRVGGTHPPNNRRSGLPPPPPHPLLGFDPATATTSPSCTPLLISV